MFFVRKFVQSLTLSREKTFVWIRQAQNVDEIDTLLLDVNIVVNLTLTVREKPLTVGQLMY